MSETPVYLNSVERQVMSLSSALDCVNDLAGCAHVVACCPRMHPYFEKLNSVAPLYAARAGGASYMIGVPERSDLAWLS
jgi:hypothetical protein